MPKSIHLTIPERCHKDWDDMLPLEKGRFCDSCKKQVVDFTDMGDHQIAAFFKKPSTGLVCGRFMSDQLDRNIATPKKRLPWVRHFFQVVLPLFLLSLKPGHVKAQTGKPTSVKPQCDAGTTGKTVVRDKGIVLGGPRLVGEVYEPRVIEGVVRGAKGEPLGYATIQQKGTRNYTAADSAGNFRLKFEGNADTNYLMASMVGYIPVTVRVSRTDLPQFDFVLYMQQKATMGVIVIVSKRKSKPVSWVKDHKMDTVNNAFTVFPNPVQGGGTIHIKLSEAGKGDYLVSVLNQSGQPVLQQKISVDKANIKLFPLSIPRITAGNYFIVLSNQKTGRQFTQKIIVQ